MSAGLEPGFQSGALLGTRVGASDVGDKQPAHRQPFLHVGEVIGDGGRNLSLGQQREEPKAGIVVVMTGAGAGRKAAGNDMSAVVEYLSHVLPLSCSSTMLSGNVPSRPSFRPCYRRERQRLPGASTSAVFGRCTLNLATEILWHKGPLGAQSMTP